MEGQLQRLKHQSRCQLISGGPRGPKVKGGSPFWSVGRSSSKSFGFGADLRCEPKLLQPTYIKTQVRKLQREGPSARYGVWATRARRCAGGYLDRDRVRRRVVKGKVVERDALCTFVTDVLSWNGTHTVVCLLECQFGAQACEIATRCSGTMCSSLRDETSVTNLQNSWRSAKVSRVADYDTRRTVRSGAAIVV